MAAVTQYRLCDHPREVAGYRITDSHKMTSRPGCLMIGEVEWVERDRWGNLGRCDDRTRRRRHHP